MIISVASGKGGTGKTLVSTNLAFSLNQDVQLLDCDVEEPNAYLFLTPDFKQFEPVNAPVPKIDLEKCTFCKKCMNICRFGAIAILKNTAMIFDNLCHSCGGCVEICPENAVDEKFRSLGKIKTGSAGSISMVQGELEIGQVMVPPIIRQVRSKTDKGAVTIIDAPPGTSCPVIAAMDGADFILLVTEPTPFGLNDLTLAVEAVKILNIPHGLVINRAGLGDDQVYQYAKKEKIPILMEIPFELQIAQTCSNGALIAEQMPEYKTKFLDLYKKIEQQVQPGEKKQ